MVELPKTQEELDALLSERENQTRESITKEFNDKFAKQRTQHQNEIDKLKADMGKSAEQLAEERIKEQQERDANELAELRNFKKQTILGEKLAKEGLPSYFKNDNRLTSAEDGDLDKVIKEVKKEYELTLPKGNTHSSVVQQSGSKPTQQLSEKEQAYESLGNVLKEVVGR